MNNEKGLTLIELLVTIAIFFIISSLIIGVFLNIQKNYLTQNNQNQLSQEANLIVATIKKYHQKNITYKIRFDSVNKKAYIGETVPDQPLVQPSENIEIKLGDHDYSEFSGDYTINPSNPLYIYIKITNANGKSIEVDTIISNYQGG